MPKKKNSKSGEIVGSETSLWETSVRMWAGYSEMVDQNRQGISLAWLSAPGTRHAFTETFETLGPGHQPFGSDCQAT